MVVYFIFILFSVLWLLMLLIGPYLLANNYDNQFFLTLYYSIFKLICHQNPDRSYFIWGYQIPVCVRCVGIYLGLPIGAIIYSMFCKINSTRLPDPKYLVVFLLPIVVDGLAQTFNLYHSPHYIRLITGIWATTGLVFWAIPLLNQFYLKYKTHLSQDV